MPDKDPSIETTWYFDSYGANPPDDKCDVELQENEDGNISLVVSLHDKKLYIDTNRDQWGLWITLSIGESAITVAQEDCTRSFLDALIDGLKELKRNTCKLLPPTRIDRKS